MRDDFEKQPKQYPDKTRQDFITTYEVSFCFQESVDRDLSII